MIVEEKKELFISEKLTVFVLAYEDAFQVLA